MPDVKIDVYADTHGAPEKLKEVETGLGGVEKGAGQTGTSLDKLFKNLGIKTVDQLRGELRDAEKALELFKRSGQSAPGVVQTLEQRIARLNQQLQGTPPAVAESSKSVGVFAGQFLKMTAAFASGQILVDIFNKAISVGRQVIEDSIKAAAEAEKVDRSLESAIQIVGKAADVSSGQLKRYASEMQRKTVYDDEAIKSAQALIIQMRGTTDSMEEQTRGAIGLAHVFSMDLQSAARAVAQGYEGNYRALQMLIPEVKAATTEGEKHAAMVAGLDRYYRAAEAATGTYSASTEQLRNAYDELLTSIGEFVVKNPELISALEGVKNIMLWLAEYIPRNAKLINMMSDLIPGVSGLKDIFRALGAAGKFAEMDLDALNRREKEGEETAKGLWKTIVANSDAMKLFGVNLGPVIEKIDELMKRSAPKGLTELDKLFKDLGIKTVPELQIELTNAETALAAFKAAGGKAVGVIEPLEKKINDLRGALEAARPASDLFTDSMKAMAGSARGFDVEPMKNNLLSLEERLYGSIAAVVKFNEEDPALVASFAAIARASHGAADGLGLITKVALRRDLAEKEAQLRKFGDAMPTEEVRKLREEIKRLKGEIADTGKWDKLKAAVAGFSAYAQAAFSGLDAIISQSQTNKEIAIENEYKKRLAAINANVKDEAERQKAIEALEAEFEIKRTSAKAAAAKQAKSIATAEAVWNTARAVAEALPNLVLAAIVGALGAVQIGTIAAQPVPLAKGGVFTKRTRFTTSSGREYEAAEEEPEVFAPKSIIKQAFSEVLNSGLSSSISRSGGGVVINGGLHLHVPDTSEAGLQKTADRFLEILHRKMRLDTSWQGA